MEIVGNGFLAKGLRPIADRHQDTVVLAAGVSWAHDTSDEDFARESALLAEVAERTRRAGQRLLFFSTASTGMYGAVDGPGREDRPVTPCTPFGEHKIAMEEQLRASGADFLTLRLGHIVGKGQPAHQLVPNLMRQLGEGSVDVHRGATRDLLDVNDVVQIIDGLLKGDHAQETINVASGEAVPVERIIDHLERRTRTTVRRVYRDVGRHHTISIDKLRALVPDVDAMGFGPDYYQRVLDGFLAGIATPTP